MLVVGGGPAGLEAAIAAAEAGADTLLIDEWPELGGSMLYRARRQRPRRDRRGAPSTRRQGAEPAKPAHHDRHDGHRPVRRQLGLGHRGNRLYKIRSKHTIVATGAFDQPLVFRNNDRPGIMFAEPRSA